MYLIDIEENPREVTSCPEGMTGHVSCSNLYYNDSYAGVREELSAIFSKVKTESCFCRGLAEPYPIADVQDHSSRCFDTLNPCTFVFAFTRAGSERLGA